LDSKVILKALILSVWLLPAVVSSAAEQTSEKVAGTSIEVICFESDDTSEHAFCNRTIVLDGNRTDHFPAAAHRYDSLIASIQSYLRKRVDENNGSKLILYGQGLNASLLAVAQTNLLPYYRSRIAGLILDNVYADWVKQCDFYGKKYPSTECQTIKAFAKQLNGRASLIETAASLSPALQVDWYWPHTLLLWSGNNRTGTQQKAMKNALENNGIRYDSFDDTSVPLHKRITDFIHALKHCPGDISRRDKPSCHGPLLRFHLGKILYRPKNEIVIRKAVSYGQSASQQYDVYYRPDTIGNPLLIYVHGGGWSHGDKRSFAALCLQYADKGFTAVGVNYRLLSLPEVGMPTLVRDVAEAIRNILRHAETFHGDPERTIVMAESAGAQLAFMALASLDKQEQKRIKLAVFNSMPSDLHLYPETKQIRLSGLANTKERQQWLKRFSPVDNLYRMSVPMLCIHSLDDKVVPPLHLQRLEAVSTQFRHPLTPVWVSNGAHPVTPVSGALQPGYSDLENKIDDLIYFRLKK